MSTVIEQVRAELRAASASAYVAFTPSNIRYVTGFGSYFVSEWWRMHGTVLAVVPADESRPVSLVVSDFESRTASAVAPDVEQRTYRLWVDLGTAEELADGGSRGERPRPEQYDEDDLTRAVAEALGSAGAQRPGARIATDLPHLTVASQARIAAAAPGADLVDLTEAMYRIRAVKQPWEVEALRRGVELSEAGMVHAARSLREGMTARDARLLYQAGVIEAARDERYAGFTDSWVLPTVGTTTSASYGAAGEGLRPGDLVKFDCGATVDGYRSDGGRTFAFGQPGAEACRLYDVLREAQDLACRSLRPGAVVADVYAAAIDHVHAHGYPAYNRGHVGHSIGIDTFHEEPPYLSRTCSEVVVPGMVFAVELPTYTPDIGAIMIEDLVVTTDGESERLHTLSHDLVVV